MRHQTASSGLAPAGSSRVQQLDPNHLPLAFDAQDPRADNSVRHIELHRERVVLRRAVRGMRMAIGVPVSDFLGVLRDESDGEAVLTLVHRDPSLSIPLASAEAAGVDAWQEWSAILALPQIDASKRPTRKPVEPAPRRRRRNAIRARRPRFLVRRQPGILARTDTIFRDEREIIARS